MSLISLYFEGWRAIVVADLVAVLQGTVRRICFWAAIVLPFLWVALLFRGVVTPAEHFALGGLVGSNLVALVIGHEHDPGLDRR